MPKPKRAPARSIARLQLDAEAKAALDQLTERRGMTQLAILSRLFEWFVSQDEVVQAAVLGLVGPEVLAEMAKLEIGRRGSSR